jgi:hypothetical protein
MPSRSGPATWCVAGVPVPPPPSFVMHRAGPHSFPFSPLLFKRAAGSLLPSLPSSTSCVPLHLYSPSSSSAHSFGRPSRCPHRIFPELHRRLPNSSEHRLGLISIRFSATLPPSSSHEAFGTIQGHRQPN